ncbi:protein of unknown function (plasmid) [Caballeronia sp. S22]
MRFKLKAIIVTGAGSGIGEGAARRFAAEGASVVLAGRSAKSSTASRAISILRERSCIPSMRRSTKRRNN